MAKRQHFAKPHKPVRLKVGKWVDLTFTFKGKVRKRFYADRAGTLEAVLYLPTEFDAGGPLPDLVRVRLVRGAWRGKPLDPTGYDERPLIAPDGVARVRFFYTGVAEPGRTYHWQAQLLGDATAQTTGTHYATFERK